MAARYDPKMKTFYERILKKKGSQKASVPVARKNACEYLLCIAKERTVSWSKRRVTNNKD